MSMQDIIGVCLEINDSCVVSVGSILGGLCVMATLLRRFQLTLEEFIATLTSSHT